MKHYRHEGNIRCGGKPVHVVFKYLSRSLLKKRSVGRLIKPPPPLLNNPFYQLDVSLKGDVTIFLIFGISFMTTVQYMYVLYVKR